MISKYAYLALIVHVNTIKHYAYICVYIDIYIYIYIYIIYNIILSFTTLMI